jgi:hypothetical protein
MVNETPEADTAEKIADNTTKMAAPCLAKQSERRFADRLSFAGREYDAYTELQYNKDGAMRN